jgi:hypothetical protein
MADPAVIPLILDSKCLENECALHFEGMKRNENIAGSFTIKRTLIKTRTYFNSEAFS